MDVIDMLGKDVGAAVDKNRADATGTGGDAS
jgi:hypothetical protein